MKERICRLLEENKALYFHLNDEIWANPELSLKEFVSSKLLIDTLKEHGFRIEENVDGMPTAFKATYGEGKPVIGFLAEYDALSSLSQKSGTPEKCPIEQGGNGHGCGHNAIGASCVASAITMKQIMEETGAKGTVVVFGCPGEERDGAKVYMARDGVFDDVDVAIAPHPAGNNFVLGCSMLANVQVEYNFSGVSAHAAGEPENGRSALDAAELMVVGVQFLREHIVQEARVHHAYLDVGGTAPNVVQSSAKLLYYIRAPKASQVREIYERVNDIARGAALMTGTKVDIDLKLGMQDYVANNVLGAIMAECWNEIGETQFSDEAWKMAAKMAPAVGMDPSGDLLDKSIGRYYPSDKALPGSTDVGDVSYIVPTAVAFFTGVLRKTPGHSWQWVAQSGTELMHDGLHHVAKVMAYTGMKVIEDPSIVDKAKAELMQKTGCKLESLVPVDAKPGA